MLVPYNTQVESAAECVRVGRHLVPFRIHHRGLLIYIFVVVSHKRLDRCKSGLSLNLRDVALSRESLDGGET